MIVFSKGYNGSTVYSLLTYKERNPIFTNKTLEELSKSIAREYPDISKKISEFFKNFSVDLPEEIDLSRLDPEPMASLIESIAIETNRKNSNN